MEKLKIQISDEEISDLKQRLAKTRFANLPESDFKAGTDESYLKEICSYWQNSYDWRKHETEINQFPNYITPISGEAVHFILIEGKGDNNIPLLLIHGWPDSFLRFKKMIPLLTEADGNGMSFTLVIPSVPGFGFSTNRNENSPLKIAKIFNELMHNILNYKKYLVHGGDWGTSIGEKIAQYHGENLVGLHLTDVPFSHSMEEPEDASEAEKKFIKKVEKWQQTAGAYAMIQSTKPNSLAPAMNDSPAGLAAWLLEKFKVWSDDFENSFSKDDLLTNASIYWFTNTFGSASRIYLNAMKDMMNDKYNPLEKINPVNHSDEKVTVPTGFSIFPKDISHPPREFAERFFNVTYWNEPSKGGHFAAMEVPEILEKEIRSFVNGL
ncbi:Soluble epoxide hydrolase [Chryseobacterium taklimakanense]|uniref:Soluble epoxide hydrolase n=1 Tax=Chryseobacterium taklimakanense TaxID=536441 RepID=A0A239WBI6_9FLAO|nr:epoxide hydrolase family protein [Chryseobacterium taklimakanense]SNV31732.1 Soluble epoxide hydrolase [Chryseobacterium taklimakanense]